MSPAGSVARATACAEVDQLGTVDSDSPHNTEEKAMKEVELHCPECHCKWLTIIENVDGYQGATVTRSPEDGEVTVDYEGEQDVDWGDSVDVGVACEECEWEYRGDDWADMLVA
jgi:copper chaperone CopZ